MSLTQFAVRYRLVSLLLLLILVAGGVFAWLVLPRREDPDLQGRAGQVIALYPGATARQVEDLVTDRLERTMLSIDDVKSVESTSRPGVAVITVDASDQARDLPKLWEDVRNRVADVRGDLPPGVTSVQVNDRFFDTAAMILGVTWPGATDWQREALAKRVRDRLRSLPDVGEVGLVGARQEQVSVSLSAQRMAQLAVTPSQVADAVARRNVLPASGGSLPLGGSRLTIEPANSLAPTGGVADLDEVRSIIVATPGGTPVYLRDLAVVARDYADPAPAFVRVNGRPAVAVSLTMRRGRNINALGEELRRELGGLRAGLPAGAALTVVNDLPRSVQRRLNEFFENLLTGVALIFAFMYLFMGLRSALIVGAMLPLTILGTFAAMALLGRDIQQISIVALIIALGLVVDNSIVVIDNIERKLSDGTDRLRAVVDGTDELRLPLLTSNLTTIASFLPLALLSGGTGEFLRDLAVVTSLASVISLLLNYMVLPLVALQFLDSTRSQHMNPLRRAFARGLDRLSVRTTRLSSAALRRPGLTVGLASAALLAALGIIPLLQLQFLPPAQRDQFTIDVTLPEGRDITATERVAARVEGILRAQPGVRSFITYVGQGGPRFYYNIPPEPPTPNYAQIVVNTQDIDATRRIALAVQKTAEATVSDARVTARSLEQGPPVPAPVAIRISGGNITALRALSADVQGILKRIPGTLSVHDDYGGLTLGLKVKVDEDRAALVGLTPADIAQATQMGFTGMTVSLLREGDKEVPVRLRLARSERASPQSLADLSLPTSTGAVVPLRQVASLSLTPQESRIVRRNNVRTITVSAFSDGRRLPSQILAAARPGITALNLPAGFRIGYGGEQEQIGQSFGEMSLIITLTILLNLIIVAWEFNSWRIVVTIMAALPFSMTGAILGLFIMGQPFGLMAFLGVTALTGVITNHEIVLFEYVLEEQRRKAPLEQALLEACRKRFRPILLTVALSIGGVLPQALHGGTLWPAMAWALIFGLLASLVQTLVVMRAFYALLEGRRGRRIPVDDKVDVVML